MLRKLREKVKQFVYKDEEYENRFLKFYYQNRKRLIKERKSAYKKKRAKGICVRCSEKSVAGTVFCSYHRKQKQAYNKKARKTT